MNHRVIFCPAPEFPEEGSCIEKINNKVENKNPLANIGMYGWGGRVGNTVDRLKNLY